MAESFGRITVTSSGTPVRATVNETTPADRVGLHSLMFERDDPNDTGLIYIGNSSAMNITTLAGVVAILAIPTSNILPVFTITITHMPNALNAANFWVDADVSSDSVLISGVVG